MNVLIAIQGKQKHAYLNTLEQKVSESAYRFMLETVSPQEIDVLLYEPSMGIRDFSQFTGLKLLQSIWAGVDSIAYNPTLLAPICRLVDDGLLMGMREYVVGHILADHIELPRFENATRWDGRWLTLASSKTVGIVGVGQLGQSCAHGLRVLGFNVIGWSRHSKAIDFPCLIGEKGLEELLVKSDYVVTLLPHTLETENIINTDFLAAMKNTAMLVNPGRGALLDEDALIAALNAGELRRAVLDVFKSEPLPQNHPFWMHERILVTPHIAAKSRVETACDVIVRNLERLSSGRPLLHQVDRQQGY